LQLTTHLSTRKDERLSWPSWLTYSGWFTHISNLLSPSCSLPSITGKQFMYMVKWHHSNNVVAIRALCCEATRRTVCS